METQQLLAALFGVTWYHLGSHQHPVPAEAPVKVTHLLTTRRCCCVLSHLQQKSWKGLRTGNPLLRIFTVSSIPEYLSWFRTNVWSNWSGICRQETTTLTQHARLLNHMF